MLYNTTIRVIETTYILIARQKPVEMPMLGIQSL